VTNRPPTIHEFTDPPVIETVLSVQFSPIEGFTLPCVGLYWKSIRQEFIHFESKPPLGYVKESFTPARAMNEPTLSFYNPGEMPFRAWFLDENRNQILQVQKDRFIHNWQKISGKETYPRYERVRDKFLVEWERFNAFLKQEGLPKPEVNLCEVTYVNHIEYEKGWKGYGELGKVISVWSGKHSGNHLEYLENVNLNATYRLPENQGRLYIAMQPVIRTRDAKEVLQLNLTARVVALPSNNEDMLQALDLGRYWIVEGFNDFTTSEIRKSVWGQTK
jgi:uncharacterized protein (TIGR04255 family)